MEMVSKHSAAMFIDLAGDLTFTGCFHSTTLQWASILVAWYGCLTIIEVLIENQFALS